MPELPEVQTLISDLNKKIKGDTIAGFWTDWPKTIKNLSVDKFTKEVRDRKILQARRIGKNIFIDLSGEKTLHIHLKMTGHLLIKTHNQQPTTHDYFNEKVNQYVHHIWYLADSKQRNKCEPAKNSNGRVHSALFACKTLEFSDLRKFGKIVLVDTGKIKEIKEIKAWGVDAMSAEFTFERFNDILDRKSASRRKKIRDILMDQNLIAGIGNIYASEILFEAGILPTHPVSKISASGRKRIFNSIKKVLKKAIKLRGTSDSDYRDTSGAPGKFQKVLKVYRREGGICRKCGTIIMRIKMGQRSAFYCPKCQH
jgi:formamidopyrimidine-DNA glycosylase